MTAESLLSSVAVGIARFLDFLVRFVRLVSP